MARAANGMMGPKQHRAEEADRPGRNFPYALSRDIAITDHTTLATRINAPGRDPSEMSGFIGHLKGIRVRIITLYVIIATAVQIRRS